MKEICKQNFLSSYVINTYGCIKLAYVEKMKSEGSSKQDIKNLLSALKSWQTVLNLSENSPIGEELGRFFYVNVSIYKARQENNNISKNTSASRISLIKKFRVFTHSFNFKNNLPPTFPERLKFLLEFNAFSANKFAEIHSAKGLKKQTLRAWINGTRYPTRSKYPLITVIESALNIPPETLTATLPIPKPRLSSIDMKIDFRIRQGNLKNHKKFYVWTASTEKELQELTEFKSTTVLPSNMKRRKNSIWTQHENNQVPSAEVLKGALKCFFGFCCLSENNKNVLFRGMGMKKDQMSLGLVTDKNLMERFITIFKKARANDKYNNGHLVFISLSTSFLRKETGYLYQKPEFAKKLNLNLSVGQWQKRCLETRNRLLEIRQSIEEAQKSGSSDFELGRNPTEPIKNILKLNQPLSMTIQMTKKMLDDFENLHKNSLLQATHYRNILLLAMLQANPLRARMFKIMELDKNLIKKSDGSWWLHFNRCHFKNRNNLTSNYSVKLAPSLGIMVETYLNIFRPIVLKSVESNLVFVTSKRNNPKNTKSELNIATISRLVFENTRKYIPNCAGFGPHAFRHIVATSIIKANPSTGFYLAAKVLNDKIETIEHAYAHLKTSELFEPYNNFFEGIWERTGLNKSE